jgi:uncharacterized protein (TIGR04222 family)
MRSPRSVATLLLFLASAVAAEEKILDFESDITISGNGALLVTETITVRAEGNRIRRGIYRDFPLRYRDRYGNEVSVHYEPQAVLRNGRREAFFSERLANGLRTYFGSADRLLPTGEHRYEFRYRVDRVLGFFEGYDELYWNVTGLDWAFPIDRVSASVALDLTGTPEILEADAYTGYAGATGDDFSVRVQGDSASFTTTRELRPHEGLTIVVTWPKGFVEAPGDLERLGWLFSDNLNLFIAVSGFAVMLVYLVPVWRRFGKDPEEGLIVTRYEPPEGLSPASLRYINQMYYDNKVMTAAIVNLAVKGYLRIDADGDDYTLVRQTPRDAPAIADSERALHDALFEDGDRLELDDKYHQRIGGARKAHRDALRREYAGRYFRKNGILGVPALVIAIGTTVAALKVGPRPTLFLAVVLGLMFAGYAFFAAIMKRPTVLGRKTLDQMLGFRDYLDIAEKDEMNLRNPPEKTPALFERYLPFALALGVEQNWSERFAGVLAGAAAGTAAYQPTWYSGAWNSFDAGHASAAVSKSLTSAISSSATPPGSSSGSGGGGFSGGGGGGGGGGGW